MDQRVDETCTTCGGLIDPRLGPDCCPRCLLAAALPFSTEGEGDARSDSQPIPEHAGRYEVLQSHGEGGMGRVFIVRDRSLDRQIALKELRPEAGAPSGSALPDARQARFLREAQITGGLEHPGITPVHELGVREDGTLYYTMKLVQGATLAELIAQSDSLEERLRYLPNLVAAGNAAAYAHSRGVIHRDIKPQNIVIGEYGETVLVDWGIAKVDADDSLWLDVESHAPTGSDSQDGLTLPGSILGTPAYMPPEQALGKNRDLDGRADVYALGAVLYALLTGSAPFTGDTATEVLEKVVREAPVPVRKRAPDAPKELVAICEKAMSKAREDRFESAQAFTEDLRRYLERLPVTSYRYTLPERALGFLIRHRAITATVMLGILATAIVSAGYTLRLRRTNAVLEETRQAETAQRLEAERAAEELRMENYVVSIRIAQQQVEEERFDAAERTLFACPPELRHWEWGYLLRRCHEELVVVPDETEEYGNLGSIFDARLSPDNRYLLLDRPGTRIKTLTDLSTGDIVWKSDALDGWRYCNGFSRDGEYMSVGLDYHRVALMRVPSGETLRTFEAPDTEVRSFILSPQNRYGAGFTESLEGERSVRVWDVADGTLVNKLTLPDASYGGMNQPPDRQSDAWMAELNYATGRVLGFSPDETTLYFHTESVQALDLEAGIVDTIAPCAQANALFAYDVQKIAIDQGHGRWELWNLDTRTLERSYDVFNGGEPPNEYIPHAMEAVVITPAADALIFRGGPGWMKWRRYSLQEGRFVFAPYSAASDFQRFSVSQDGRYLVSAALNEARIWSLAYPYNPSYYPYRRGDEQFRLPFPHNNRTFFAAEYSEDAEHLFAADAHGGLHVITLPTFEEARFWEDHDTPMLALACTRDDEVLTGSGTGRIVIRRVGVDETPRAIELGSDKRVEAIAVSRDGNVLACGTEGAGTESTNEVTLYRYETFEPLATVWTSHNQDSVTRIAFSPDGRWLVLGVNTKRGRHGSYISIYDADALQEVNRIEGVGEPISFDFTAESDRLLVSSHGIGPILYDLVRQREIWRLDEFPSMFAVFHPSGDRFYALSDTGHGTIFAVSGPRELVAIEECGVRAAWSADGRTLYSHVGITSGHESDFGRRIQSEPTHLRDANDLRELQRSRFQM